ncbi:MAG: hypothetical protein ACK4JD_02215 [Thermoflexales bacterium]
MNTDSRSILASLRGFSLCAIVAALVVSASPVTTARAGQLAHAHPAGRQPYTVVHADAEAHAYPHPTLSAKHSNAPAGDATYPGG